MGSPIGRLVVVGASLAGLRAVEAARRDGFDGSITLIGDEPHPPYDRPPLSKACLTEEGSPDTTLRSAVSLRSELGVECRFGSRATGLDTADKHVLTDSGAVPYDALVIATGASARQLPESGQLEGVHSFRTHDDAAAVREALASGARMLVVGAGFIGSEVASAARERGLPVTVVEASAVPLARAVGPGMGAVLSSLHHRNGTDLRCGVTVSAIDGGERTKTVHLSDGTVLEVDLVVAGIGADPATDWLTDSSLDIDNGIVCDEFLHTGADGVYAAGDVARWANPAFGRVMRIEHWSSAAEQGAVAAVNAVSPEVRRAYSTVPYFWSDWYGSRIQFVGVPDCDESQVIEGDLEADGETIVFFRTGERLTGVLAVNRRAEIMKYRALITRGATFTEALDFAEQRRRARAARINA